MGQNDGSAAPAPAQGAAAQTPAPGAAAPAPKDQAWMAQLPGDLQKNETLAQFATIGELGKAHLDLLGKMQRAIIKPGEGASEADVAAYYEQRGRPKTADEYELKREILQGMQSDPEYDKFFKALSHKTGLSKEEAQAFYEGLGTYQNGRITQELSKAQAAEKAKSDAEAARLAALKTEWGPKHDENVVLAGRAFKELGGDELASFMETDIPGVGKLGQHPIVLKGFRNIWGKIAEDHFVGGDRPGEVKDLAHRMFPDNP